MLVIGLTGSIGMGKSTTAGLFREAGVTVFDADASVHDLYAGRGAAKLAAAFPETIVEGHVDRGLMPAAVLDRPDALKRLEAILHPLVREEREAFLDAARQAGEPIAVLDIPLLFETGGDREVDRVVVVSAEEAVQKARVLARPGMTPERLSFILAKQIPDADKRRRADAVIDTGQGIPAARAQVRALLERWREASGKNA